MVDQFNIRYVKASSAETGIFWKILYVDLESMDVLCIFKKNQTHTD